MKQYSIEEQSTGIVITIDNDYEYIIPKASFQDQEGGISSWIEQLLEKKWADKTMLYEVGAIISKSAGTSEIDWVETFIYVEKFLLLDSQINLDNPDKNKNDGLSIRPASEIYAEGLRELESTRSLNTEEMHETIKRDVETNLKQYGISFGS